MALAVGTLIYFLGRYFSYEYIDTVYSSEENKKAREIEYINDLQLFVDENEISSDGTSMLSEWTMENKYVYLIIYKDNELLYTSDDTSGGDSEAEDSVDSIPDQSGAVNAEVTVKWPGGITVEYPSRSELFEYANLNDLHTLSLNDGTMFAALTDFTEYFYYDISNIASLFVALFSVLITLVFYFHTVTTRIIRLGNEVNKVADGDTSHVISSRGNDEISRLSVNVENMRSSMIDNFKREREAIEANTALITSMSHDIRTPLTILLGYIDLMQNKSEMDPELQGYLKAAESTAMRLKTLSDDMFGYFLVFGGNGPEVDIEDYDAATLVDQMLFEHITLMRESGYNVDFDGVDYEALASLMIRTDPQRLVRIFDNVFSNIYKYAQKSATVSIRLEMGEDLLTMKFSNTVSSDVGRVESNCIGLKTCKKLAEHVNAIFTTESSEDIFTAILTLKLVKNERL